MWKSETVLLVGVRPTGKPDLPPFRIRMLAEKQNRVADRADQFGAGRFRQFFRHCMAVVGAVFEPNLDEFVLVQGPGEFGDEGIVDTVLTEMDRGTKNLADPAEERFLEALHVKTVERYAPSER